MRMSKVSLLFAAWIGYENAVVSQPHGDRVNYFRNRASVNAIRKGSINKDNIRKSLSYRHNMIHNRLDHKAHFEKESVNGKVMRNLPLSSEELQNMRDQAVNLGYEYITCRDDQLRCANVTCRADKEQECNVKQQRALRTCQRANSILTLNPENGQSLCDPYPAACSRGVCPGLGEAVFMPDEDTIKHPLTHTMNFFKTTRISDNCVDVEPEDSVVVREVRQYNSMRHFVESQSQEVNIEGGYSAIAYSMTASTNAQTSSSVETNENFTSASLKIYQAPTKLSFNRDCKTADNVRSEVKQEFDSLPIPTHNALEPFQDRDFSPYVRFLRNYGSHIVDQVSIGSMYHTWASSNDNSRDSSEALAVRLCLGAQQEVGGNVNGCAGHNSAVQETARTMSAQEDSVIMGGSDAARSNLVAEKNPANLAAFISSAKDATQVVGTKYKPIWSIYKNQFRLSCNQNGQGSNACQSLQRAILLEAAYKLFLALDCKYEADGPNGHGQAYQQIQYTQDGFNGIRDLQCWVAGSGCRADSDCQDDGLFSAGWACYAYGDSAIRRTQNALGVAKNEIRKHKEGDGKIDASCTHIDNWVSRTNQGCYCNHEHQDAEMITGCTGPIC